MFFDLARLCFAHSTQRSWKRIPNLIAAVVTGSRLLSTNVVRLGHGYTDSKAWENEGIHSRTFDLASKLDFLRKWDGLFR
jgi:hypothetical protein